jgi:hypothetical protein
MQTIVKELNQENNNVSDYNEVITELSSKVLKKLKEAKNAEILLYIRNNYKYLTISEMANKLGLNSHHNVTGLFIHEYFDKRLIAKTEAQLLRLIAQKNTYTNGDGIEKERVRNILANEVEASGVVGKYLGLPFYTADFEKKIYNRIPTMSFVGCETEKNTFLLRKKYDILEDFPMEMHNCKLSKMIRNSEPNTYAHVFLDYMGGLHKFGSEIVEAMDRQIVQIGGTLAITIQNAQRYGLVKETSRFARKLDNRTASSKMIDKFICDVKGDDYELLSNNYYKDDKHVGMNLIILKRLK